MKNIKLVIGSEGFIGKAFINYHKKFENSSIELFTVDIIDIDKKNYYKCDATNFQIIEKIIQSVQPDEIYNFSGSFSDIYEKSYLTNVIISKNIFDSVLLHNLNECKILINGSAAEYGAINEKDNPIKENHPLNPINFYGLTKTWQTYLAKLYFLREDVQVYIARPFNIIGYGISPNLFIGRLINEIKKNLEKKNKIILGNLNSERDYLDIDDVIRAYLKIMEKGVPGDIYNIGSGKSIIIGELLKIFLNLFKIEKNMVQINKSLIKKADIPKIIADNSKLKKLNWNLTISLEESVLQIKKKMYQ